MSAEQASKIVSMRPIIEQLVVTICNQPQLISDPNPSDEHQKVLTAIRRFDALLCFLFIYCFLVFVEIVRILFL